MSPSPAARLDLLERLQEQQMAINDMTRQALATLNEALRTQQRTIDREMRMLDEVRSQTMRHDELLARLETTLAAIKDLLNRPNGH